MLSIMGERERTHLVLQYVTMCIHVDWCLASFLSFLSSIVIMDMSQSLSDIGILLLYIYNYAHLVFNDTT